jgi:hypothetical protein
MVVKIVWQISVETRSNALVAGRPYRSDVVTMQWQGCGPLNLAELAHSDADLHVINRRFGATPRGLLPAVDKGVFPASRRAGSNTGLAALKLRLSRYPL